MFEFNRAFRTITSIGDMACDLAELIRTGVSITAIDRFSDVCRSIKRCAKDTIHSLPDFVETMQDDEKMEDLMEHSYETMKRVYRKFGK